MLIIAREFADPPTLVLSVKGRIDKLSFHEFEEAMEELLRRVGMNVVVDMSAVPAINSQGIGLLMSYARTVGQRGGEIRFAAVNVMVEQVLRVTNVHKVIPIHLTVQEALEAFPTRT